MFFKRKLIKELGAEITTFFNSQKCNIENSNFRKKPIVDFQEKFTKEKIFKKIMIPFNEHKPYAVLW